MKIKLSEWAKDNGVCYRTAWNYAKQGKIKEKIETTESGSIFVIIPDKNRELEMFEMIKEIYEKIINE